MIAPSLATVTLLTDREFLLKTDTDKNQNNY